MKNKISLTTGILATIQIAITTMAMFSVLGVSIGLMIKLALIISGV